jgi:hypothetical protein
MQATERVITPAEYQVFVDEEREVGAGGVCGFVWCFGRRRYQLEVGIPEGTYGYGLTDLSLGFLMRGALWLEMVQSSFVPRKTPYSRIFFFF